MILCAGSNRSVYVYDAAAGRNAAVFEDAHSKPVHTIVMAANSATASVVPMSMVCEQFV